MQTIELYNDPDFTVSVVLDNVLYFLILSWNSEALFWTMALEDYNHNLLISGVKVIPNFRLLKRYTLDGLPPGDFIVVTDGSSIGLSDFSEGFATMIYVSAAELPQ